MIERARAAPRGAGPGHDPVPRRDPSLQQGPAGRAAAERGGRPAGADRGHHREPVLRGQPAAALSGRRCSASSRSTAEASRRWPHRGLAAEGATRRRPTPSTTCRPRRAATAASCSPASRWPSPSRHRRPRAAGRRDARPTPRTRSAPRPCATAATTTTTSSAPSSRASAARIPTPGSTGWPACSRRARTPASSPAGWSSWPARTSAWPTRMAPRRGRRRRPGRRVRRAARGAAQPGPGRRPPGHGAEVEPGRPRHLERAARTCARARAARCPPTCATRTTRGRRCSVTARATTTLTTIPRGWVPQQYRPAERGRPRLLRPVRATGSSRRCAGAWRRDATVDGSR